MSLGAAKRSTVVLLWESPWGASWGRADACPRRRATTAVGHAYMRPVAENDSEEGRTRNRRIEITLYSKNLKNIASEFVK